MKIIFNLKIIGKRVVGSNILVKFQFNQIFCLLDNFVLSEYVFLEEYLFFCLYFYLS